MQGHSEVFTAGTSIFVEGDRSDCAYLIESGQVEISTTQRGEKRVLGVLGPGALLGEMAVLDDSTRTASARALSECRLIPIDREQLAERLDAADPVVRAVLMGLLARYRSALATLTGDRTRSDSRAARYDDAFALDKIRLESELRLALEQRALEVRLQAIAEIADGSVAGYEALVRWQHPERGAVSPAEFIRLAEETSLIHPIGEYVLERVCDMLAELRDADPAPLPFIAVNVSARQIEDPDLVPRILAMLRARDLPPDRLKIEVTESLVMDTARIGELIRRCHDEGMPVALDDFGTGYSNLGPLLTLDFDTIKLDASFVRALDHSRGVAMVGVIVDMARALGCDLVAEGVETQEQHEILRNLGCRYAQGWLVGKPLPFGEIRAR